MSEKDKKKKEENIDLDNNTINKIEKIKLKVNISIFPQKNNFFENLSIFYISKILNLWELIITLKVQADSPITSSEVVFLLESLIFPLKYCGDIRPYFTIYDADFRYYKWIGLKNLNSPIIIGVINPICVRTFNEWAVLHFDDNYFQELNYSSNPTKNNNINFIDYNFDDGLDIPNVNKKRFIMQISKALIKTFFDFINEDGKKSMDKLNMYLRMYLIELNNDFMRSFEEFFFSHEIKNIQRISLIKNNFSIFEIFSKENFSKYLNTKNTYFNQKYVNDKKKTNELYMIFIQTKCFNNYLKSLL